MRNFEQLGNTRVLIVDDKKEIHDDFREVLQGGDALSSGELPSAVDMSSQASVMPTFQLLHAVSGEDACEIVRAARARNQPVAVAFVDVGMPPGIDGVEAIRRIRAVDREIELAIMTAYPDKPLADIVEKMELLDRLLYILRKPFAREQIQQMTLSLVTKWNVEREVAARRSRRDGVLNATGEAIALYDRSGRLVFANRWYERLFNISLEQLHAMPRDAAMAQFTECLHDVPSPHADGRFPLEHDNGAVVEPTGANGGRRHKPLLYRSTQPVREANMTVVGDLAERDVSREFEIDRMKAEVQRLRSELRMTGSVDGIVGGSSEIRKMCALVRQAANTDVGVLVKGESGAGKEVVARALHFEGPRRNGPYVAVNFAAVPETLIESELFGDERGACTGATSRRTGCFEEANGGTLLLDEIGDMPLALQPKLLRVLQEREIRRAGGKSTIPVDARIVAMTNRDLDAAIREGAFREDLYCHLAVFPIVVPALRERVEDIPLLADHFVKKHAVRLGKQVRGISTGAVRLLARYAWPGNVRELENAICRALVIETTDVLRAASFQPSW